MISIVEIQNLKQPILYVSELCFNPLYKYVICKYFEYNDFSCSNELNINIVDEVQSIKDNRLIILSTKMLNIDILKRKYEDFLDINTLFMYKDITSRSYEYFKNIIFEILPLALNMNITDYEYEYILDQTYPKYDIICEYLIDEDCPYIKKHTVIYNHYNEYKNKTIKKLLYLVFSDSYNYNVENILYCIDLAKSYNKNVLLYIDIDINFDIKELSKDISLELYKSDLAINIKTYCDKYSSKWLSFFKSY